MSQFEQIQVLSFKLIRDVGYKYSKCNFVQIEPKHNRLSSLHSFSASRIHFAILVFTLILL